MTLAFGHASESYESNVPLPALLSSLSFAHSQTLSIIAERLNGDRQRARSISPTSSSVWRWSKPM
jgi:methyl-accepting chemotaxis protein